MSPVAAAGLIIACLVFCSIVNTYTINRRRDRARDERALEARRRRGGLV